MLAKFLGSKFIIVVINKMDSINWDKNRYELIKKELKNFLLNDCLFD